MPSDLGDDPYTTATLAELREEYNAQQGAIDNLRTCLDEARAIQNALTAAFAAMGNVPTNATTNAATTTHGEHLRILDPEKYRGDREKLYPFIIELRLKAVLYLDYQSQLYYTVSLLKDPALD